MRDYRHTKWIVNSCVPYFFPSVYVRELNDALHWEYFQTLFIR